MKLGQLFFLLPLSYALDITNYPNALAVLGNGGPAGEKYPERMGLFVQTGATYAGVPVWMNSNGMYFHYSDYYGDHWNGDYGSYGWWSISHRNGGYIYHLSSSEKI